MKLKTSELSNIAKITKHFLSQAVIDERMRFISFRKAGIIAMNNYAGVLYTPDFELAEEFILPFDMFIKLSSLFGKSSEVTIKLKGGMLRWKFGSYKYTTPLVEVRSIVFPKRTDSDKMIKLNGGLLAAIAKAIFAAGEDVRQQQLCGVYINEGEVWACDNSRAYIKEAKELKEIKDLFISQEIVTLLRGIGKDPAQLVLSENKTFFNYENPDFLVFVSGVGFEYPDVSQFFTKVVPSQAVIKVTDYDKGSVRNKLKGLLSILDDKMERAMAVSVDNEKMKLALRSPIRGDELVLSIKGKSSRKGEARLVLNSKYFMEALLRYDTFYVFPQYVYFEDKTSKHILMVMK